MWAASALAAHTSIESYDLVDQVGGVTVDEGVGQRIEIARMQQLLVKRD